MTTDLLPIKGAPGSPYTRKMLAVLRYRRIPYRFIQATGVADDDLPKPKVSVIPVLYFADEQGALSAEVDSTPIIRRLEDEYPGRSVIPSDPAIGFLNYLIEDYGDEWLTKCMFHYRWHYAADIDLAGSILPFYRGVAQPDEEWQQMKQLFIERQTSRLYVVGSNETTTPVIESSYQRFLDLLNKHLTELPFIMGERPGSADFACFGQLTQLAQFDPTPAKVASEQFPRVHAWVSKMEDLSGLESADDGFIDAVPATLRDLLVEIGHTYVPVMLANAAALNEGKKQVETQIDGQPWVQQPFPYQGKCLQWIRAGYARQDPEDRERIDQMLAGTGCEALLAK